MELEIMKGGLPQTVVLKGTGAAVAIEVTPFTERSLRVKCVSITAPSIGSRQVVIERYFFGRLKRDVEYEVISEAVLEVQHCFTRYPKAGDPGEMVALKAGEQLEIKPYLPWGYWSVICSPIFAVRKVDNGEVVDNRGFTDDVLSIRFNVFGRKY
jgi:hypothetical protein